MRTSIAVVVGTTGPLTATLAFGALSTGDGKQLDNATPVISESLHSSVTR